LPRRLARLAGSAAVLATLLVHALLQAVPAIAAAPPTQTPCAGAPAVDDPAPSFVDAFAQPLADGAVLALTARIVRAPQDARAALLESVKHPPSAAVRAAVDRAVRAKCAAPLISQAAVRAANELAVVWSDLPSDRVDAYIAQRLIFALAAEAVRDALPAETLAAALDGAVPPAEGPPLAPPASCTAADSIPKVVHAVQPQYPANPAALRTGGSVRVEVQLDAQGFVRSTKFHGATFTAGDGDHDALRESALVSAASSTYGPTTAGCPIAPGTYLFRVDFQVR
jgi:hypothetical protein